MEIQVASGVATDLKVLLLAGFVLIGPDTRERRAGGCTVNLGFDTGRGDFACIQRRQTIDQVTVQPYGSAASAKTGSIGSTKRRSVLKHTHT